MILFLVLSVTNTMAQSWNPEIVIINGTTSQSGSIDSLKIITINTSMIPLGELSGFTGSKKIENMSLPDDLPVLFQAKYKGVTYNKMVPPAPIFRQKPVEITVYETISEFNGLDIKSVIQIVREENFLRFVKLYIFNNSTNPKRSYLSIPPPEIFIPENAEDVRGQFTQSDSKMGIPLTLAKGRLGRIFERGILPGQSDLIISYKIPSKKNELTTIEDQILFEKEDSKVFLINPPDMVVRGRDLQTSILQESGPDGMLGISIKYNNKKAFLEIRGGEPIKKEAEVQERKVINGTIFTNWQNSTYGVLAVVALLFSLSFIFIYNQSKFKNEK